MLYVIKRLSDSYYISSFEECRGVIYCITYTPIQTDALKFPQKVAERYSNMLNKERNDVHKAVSAIKEKEI